MARYPTVTFDEEPIEVATVTLDTYTRPLPGLIDFIWADVQGAEHLLIAGGRETLARTRHFFTEYSDVELYQGQRSLEALLALLPGWEITSRWEDDALLTNRRLG
jgi:hypothetical protein